MAETTASPEADFDSLDPGTTLGRYTILAKIGQGGMAEIYLARQAGPRGFERLCAVKVMRDMMQGDDSHYDMFLDEARIAAQLSHPNIVQIYDFGEEEGRLYLAMEYLAGETLGAVLRRARSQRPFPLAYSAHVVAQAAQALDYAHGSRDMMGKPLNIVHRDISPDNLFITYQGTVKVLDFGIAKASSRSSQTAVGMVKGKVAYMSPEQLKGLDLDGRSDVYALGVVLYEALGGVHPFDKKTNLVLEYLTGKAPLTRARLFNAELPQELDDLVANAMERDRDQRVHSALELQRMLQAWLQSQDAVTPSALAAWMRENFDARMASRAKLLEDAMASGGALAGLSNPARPGTEPELPAYVPGAGSGEAGPAAARPAQKPGGEESTVVASDAGPGIELLAGIPVPKEQPPEAVHTDVDGPTPPPPRSRLGLVVGGLVGLAVIGGAIALLGRSPKEPTAPQPEPNAQVAPKPTQEPSAPPAEPPPVAVAQAKVEPPVAKPEVVVQADAPAPTPAPAIAPDAKAHVAKVRPAGKLTLDTVPWTSVYEGKKHLGDTPLFQLALPAGTHELSLVNPASHIQQAVKVTIKPGEVTAQRLTLGK